MVSCTTTTVDVVITLDFSSPVSAGDQVMKAMAGNTTAHPRPPAWGNTNLHSIVNPALWQAPQQLSLLRHRNMGLLMLSRAPHTDVALCLGPESVSSAETQVVFYWVSSLLSHEGPIGSSSEHCRQRCAWEKALAASGTWGINPTNEELIHEDVCLSFRVLGMS